MKPSLVIPGQDSIWASLLEAADEVLQAADSPTNELGTTEWLQTAVTLFVVLLDQVIDTYCWIAVCHIESTTCKAQDSDHVIPSKQKNILMVLVGKCTALYFVLCTFILQFIAILIFIH